MESQAEDMLSGSQGSNTASGLSASQGSSREESEVARFGAAKEKKHSLENGITVFNRSCCSPLFTLENRRHTAGLFKYTEECYTSLFVLVLVLVLVLIMYDCILLLCSYICMSVYTKCIYLCMSTRERSLPQQLMAYYHALQQTGAAVLT